MTRLNKILIGALVVQLVLVFVLHAGGSDRDARIVETPVLAGFDATSVTRIQVFADSGAKPAVELVKRGKDWVLASHFDYPAEPSKITEMLTPIAKMAAGEPIATSATRHNQLKVGDAEFDRKLVLTTGGKDVVLYVGASAGLRRTAIRLGGDDRVLGVAGVQAHSINAQPRDWVHLSYFETPRADIAKVVVQRGTSSLELERVTPTPSPAGSGAVPSPTPTPSDQWKVTLDGAAIVLAAGETLDSAAIDAIVGAVSSIDAQPADPKRDSSKPTATIAISRKGGTDTLDVIADGDKYWVKQRGIDRATLVDKPRLEPVLAAERGKLVKKPDPKPAGAGSAAMPMPMPMPDMPDMPGMPGLEP